MLNLMQLLTNQDLEALLQQLPNWYVEQGKLSRELVFASFSEAFAFITQVALLAEKLNHHPNWCNSYNRVSLSLITHEKNALTNKDAELALAIEKILTHLKTHPKS